MKPKETRTMRCMINKVGGNAGSGAVNYRVSLPSVWATEMNISKENPELVMTFDGNKIVITKRGENNG